MTYENSISAVYDLIYPNRYVEYNDSGEIKLFKPETSTASTKSVKFRAFDSALKTDLERLTLPYLKCSIKPRVLHIDKTSDFITSDVKNNGSGSLASQVLNIKSKSAAKTVNITNDEPLATWSIPLKISSGISLKIAADHAASEFKQIFDIVDPLIENSYKLATEYDTPKAGGPLTLTTTGDTLYLVGSVNIDNELHTYYIYPQYAVGESFMTFIKVVYEPFGNTFTSSIGKVQGYSNPVGDIRECVSHTSTLTEPCILWEALRFNSGQSYEVSISRASFNVSIESGDSVLSCVQAKQSIDGGQPSKVMTKINNGVHPFAYSLTSSGGLLTAYSYQTIFNPSPEKVIFFSSHINTSTSSYETRVTYLRYDDEQNSLTDQTTFNDDEGPWSFDAPFGYIGETPVTIRIQNNIGAHEFVINKTVDILNADGTYNGNYSNEEEFYKTTLNEGIETPEMFRVLNSIYNTLTPELSVLYHNAGGDDYITLSDQNTPVLGLFPSIFQYGIYPVNGELIGHLQPVVGDLTLYREVRNSTDIINTLRLNDSYYMQTSQPNSFGMRLINQTGMVPQNIINDAVKAVVITVANVTRTTTGQAYIYNPTASYFGLSHMIPTSVCLEEIDHKGDIVRYGSPMLNSYEFINIPHLPPPVIDGNNPINYGNYLTHPANFKNDLYRLNNDGNSMSVPIMILTKGNNETQNNSQNVSVVVLYELEITTEPSYFDIKLNDQLLPFLKNDIWNYLNRDATSDPWNCNVKEYDTADMLNVQNVDMFNILNTALLLNSVDTSLKLICADITSPLGVVFHVSESSYVDFKEARVGPNMPYIVCRIVDSSNAILTPEDARKIYEALTISLDWVYV